jgi:hypothetical protein
MPPFHSERAASQDTRPRIGSQLSSMRSELTRYGPALASSNLTSALIISFSPALRCACDQNSRMKQIVTAPTTIGAKQMEAPSILVSV